MRRRQSFERVWEKNWVVGRDLLPLLADAGRHVVGDVLDLGCGESPFRDCFHNARRYCRVDRVRLDPEIVAGSLCAIPFPDRDFDVVLLFQALTDVPHMEVVLAEVKRVLRPGGFVLILETTCYPEHDAPNDYYRLMPQGARWLAETAGFASVEVHELGGLFARFASLWNNYLMGGLQRWVLLKPVAIAGTLAANLLALGLDRLLPHPRLAPDYLAKLTLAAKAAATNDDAAERMGGHA